MCAEYEKDTARAGILYVAKRVAEPTFHKISKIFYFADRYHLEHYGSLMFGDTYKALDWGPLPTETHRVMAGVERHELEAETEGFFVTRQHVEGSPDPAPVVHPLKEPDMDYLSQSMLESLDPAIALCKDKTFEELCDLSHDEAWTEIRRSTGRRAPVMSTEFIASTLPNAESVLSYLRDPYPGEARKSVSS